MRLYYEDMKAMESWNKGDQSLAEEEGAWVLW